MSSTVLGVERWAFLTPALLFGATFDLMFFGILTAQVYVYYTSFPQDRLLFMLAVAWVHLVGLVQTGLALFDVRITWLTGLQALNNVHDRPAVRPDHLWLSITASTVAVIIVIHALYAHRIYVISKKRWLAIMIVSMSVAQLAIGTLGAVCFSQERAVYSGLIFEEVGGALVGDRACRIGFVWIWGPLNVICDLTITICMVTFLLRHRRRTVRGKTRSRIMRIVQIVVETGMATTVLMTVYTFLFAFESDLALYIGPFFPLPGLIMSKVYSNSMLVLLNNRATIVSGKDAMDSSEIVDVSVRGPGGNIEMRDMARKFLADSSAP